MESLNPVLFHIDKCIVKHFQTTVIGISQFNIKFSKFLVICKQRAWPGCSSYWERKEESASYQFLGLRQVEWTRAPLLDGEMKQLMVSSLLCSSRRCPGPEPLLAAWILTACWSCFQCVEIFCPFWGAPAQWVPNTRRSTFMVKTKDPGLLSQTVQHQSPRSKSQRSPLVAKGVGKMGGYQHALYKTCWLWVSEFHKAAGRHLTSINLHV